MVTICLVTQASQSRAPMTPHRAMVTDQPSTVGDTPTRKGGRLPAVHQYTPMHSEVKKASMPVHIR